MIHTTSLKLAKVLQLHRDTVDEFIEQMQIDFGIFDSTEWTKEGYTLTKPETEYIIHHFLLKTHSKSLLDYLIK